MSRRLIALEDSWKRWLVRLDDRLEVELSGIALGTTRSLLVLDLTADKARDCSCSKLVLAVDSLHLVSDLFHLLELLG